MLCAAWWLPAAAVARVFVRDDVPILAVCVDDTAVTTTAEHPFWVTDAGWTEAGGLEPGMTLRTASGATAAVRSVETLDRTATGASNGNQGR